MEINKCSYFFDVPIETFEKSKKEAEDIIFGKPENRIKCRLAVNMFKDLLDVLDISYITIENRMHDSGDMLVSKMKIPVDVKYISQSDRLIIKDEHFNGTERMYVVVRFDENNKVAEMKCMNSKEIRENGKIDRKIVEPNIEIDFSLLHPISELIEHINKNEEVF